MYQFFVIFVLLPIQMKPTETEKKIIQQIVKIIDDKTPRLSENGHRRVLEEVAAIATTKLKRLNG